MTVSRFHSDLVVKVLRSRTFWKRPKYELVADLNYYSRLLNKTVTVECGRKTDFASIPNLWLLYGLFGDVADKAAAVHDLLYQFHLDLSRKTADCVLFEAMQVDTPPVPIIICYIFYFTVRLFGWAAWRKHNG